MSNFIEIEQYERKPNMSGQLVKKSVGKILLNLDKVCIVRRDEINDANYVLCDGGVIIEANYTDYLRIKEAVND